MKIFIYSILIVFSFALSISAQASEKKEAVLPTDESKTVAETNDLTDEEQIQEVVFRKMINSWFSGFDKKYTYYLSFADRDPSSNVLKRLINSSFLVKNSSELILFDENGFVEQKAQDTLLSVFNINWKSKNEVKLNAEILTGSNGCEFILKKEGNEWKIIEENCWVA